MEWLFKLLHVGFMSFWIGGALYLPRLFHGHARATEASDVQRFIELERRVYMVVMTPGALATVTLGIVLIFFGYQGGWLPVKLALVLLLTVYHLYCGHILLQLEKHQPPHSPVFFTVLGWAPVPLMLTIVLLAIAKPF